MGAIAGVRQILNAHGMRTQLRVGPTARNDAVPVGAFDLIRAEPAIGIFR